jgi:putative ABC transport system substrate-binding protein
MNRRGFITALSGAAVAWPSALYAQQTKPYRISFLALVPGEDTTLMKSLLERLHELGYGEGTNMIFKYRSAEGRPERLAQLAMELVQDKPDVLLAGFGTLAAQAAKAATTTFPSYLPRSATHWVRVSSRVLPGPVQMSPALPIRRKTFKANGCNFFRS